MTHIVTLCIHQHQPVSHLENSVSQAFTRAYLPLLDLIAKHQNLHLSLHYSATLLERIQTMPQTLQLLKELVASERVELLSGAMFEALLPLVPRTDAIEQMRYQSQMMERLFGKIPKGAWLTEFAWEPHFPALINEAGLEYTLLDDTQCAAAGLEKQQTVRPFRSEDQSLAVTIVPILNTFRTMMPFKNVQEVIRKIKTQPSGMVAIALDAEILAGLNGGLDAFKTGWLEDFFTALETEPAAFQTSTFEASIQKYPPVDLIYLPSSPNLQVTQYALLQEQARLLEQPQLEAAPQPSLRVGSWRATLHKYPEAAHLAQRVARVSKKMQLTPRASRAAYLNLWRAESGMTYWHGGTGGIYQNFLRAQAYTNAIQAENAIEPRKYAWLEIEQNDFDHDGKPEIVAESHTLNVYFKPNIGGTITELDHRASATNVLNTFTRKPEPYHPHGATYDTYPRHSLVDHFIGAESNLIDFATNMHLELADFTTGAFEASKYRDRVTLIRNGFVRGPIGEPVPIEVKKAVRIMHKQSRLDIEYTIKNKGVVDVITRFGSEWNFGGFLDPASTQRYITINGRATGQLAQTSEHRNVRTTSLIDELLGIDIDFDFDGRDVLLWRHPIETLEKIDQAFIMQYQSTVIVPLWDLDLPMGRSRRIAYSVRIHERD